MTEIIIGSYKEKGVHIDKIKTGIKHGKIWVLEKLHDRWPEGSFRLAIRTKKYKIDIILCEYPTEKQLDEILGLLESRTPDALKRAEA